MNRDIDELFEGDFSDTEKSAVAKRVMELQDRIRSSGRTEIVLTAIFSAVCLVIAALGILYFPIIVDREMDPRAVPTSRNLTGKAGVAQDVLFILSALFTVYMPINAAVAAEKENRLYREFKARKFTVSSVTEDASIKGLYTVTANCGGRKIRFDTADSAAKEYAENSIMIVVEFLAVKESTPEKGYEYYTASAEQRRVMALRKASDRKYIIVRI